MCLGPGISFKKTPFSLGFSSRYSNTHVTCEGSGGASGIYCCFKNLFEIGLWQAQKLVQRPDLCLGAWLDNS